MPASYKGPVIGFTPSDVTPLKKRAMKMLEQHGINTVSYNACAKATAELYEGNFNVEEALEFIVNDAFFTADWY